MKEENNENVKRDVILFISVAIAILLFISNIGFGGIVGEAVSSFLFGMFGLISYLFPILFLLGTFFVTANKNNKVVLIKLISAVLFLFFLCTFMDLILHGDLIKGPVPSFKYSAEHKNGGGFIGGGIGFLLFKGFSLVGAYVIDIIVIIISIILMLQKSAIKLFEGFFKDLSRERRVRNNLKKKERKRLLEDKEKEKERRENRKRETRENENDIEGSSLNNTENEENGENGENTEAFGNENIDRRRLKVHGVTLDTRIKENEDKDLLSDETKEIKPDAISFLDDIERITLYPGQESADNTKSFFNDEEKAKKEEAKRIEKPKEKEEEKKDIGNESSYIKTETKEERTEKIEKAVIKKEEKKEEIPDISENDSDYIFPPISLLSQGNGKMDGESNSSIQETKKKLEETLSNFGVNVTVTDCSVGPAVTRYELSPEQGTKVSKIVNLSDDIKLNLAASDIRIEAPIPGKPAVGIEVPNKNPSVVTFRELIEDDAFKNSKSKLSFAVGKDIGGKVVIADIKKMPHVLIAGATGSGKSVCINTIIMSILYHSSPDDVKFIMIDPKVVELSVYNGIPHLLIPVVTDPKKAAGALQWAVKEMMERYDKFAGAGVRQMSEYNKLVKEGKIDDKKLPHIVLIVDELADLMMVASKEVEDSICRIAQLARAAGIHLVIATQRPSVNVITGLIKANMPSRIAFAVTSGIDSRTILDMVGAEKLLGKGDMLYFPQGVPKPLRVQGAFVPDEDVHKVTEFLRENSKSEYDESVQEAVKAVESEKVSVENPGSSAPDDGRDSYFPDAGRFIIEKEKASIGLLQRQFKIGFNRAARIMEQLSDAGVVGPEVGTKPRQILISAQEFEELLASFEQD